MPTFQFVTVDVFTEAPFGGNQLAVFPDARGIPEARLLDVTREFNFSETTFVYPAERSEHTRRVRIFTPASEIPFAGHPTVGTAHVLAHLGEIHLAGDRTEIVLEENVGPVPVVISSKNGKPVFCQLSVAKLPEAGPPPPARGILADLLSLSPDDLLDGEWSAAGYSCGLPFLYVALRDRAAVARARVRLEPWEAALKGQWSQEIFVFAREGERQGSDIHARMFAPGLNIAEDPATGSACAGLAGYLAPRDLTGNGLRRWRVEQGFEMGRPSILDVEADIGDGAVRAVRVGGNSVIMSEGRMNIPSMK